MHTARLFHAEEKYGVYRWIGNKILHHFELLKFEIGLLEAEKTKFPNLNKITFFFKEKLHGKVLCKINFRNQFSSTGSARIR